MNIKKLIMKLPAPVVIYLRSARRFLRRILTSIVLRCRSAWWFLRRILKLRERVPGNDKLSVVLLSYRRAKNLRHIVDSLLLCEFVREIVLSNNNPDVKMEDYISVRDPRLSIINQPVHYFASKRYELARELNSKYFMSTDDDLFLTPGQVRRLFMALIENPSVPHGVGGEDFAIEDGKVMSRSVHRKKRETDVILWAYVFTREHLLKYFSLLDRLQINNIDVISDDVVISFAGNSRPRCEDLGRILFCVSSNNRDVATFMQDGFYEHRDHLYLECLNATAVRCGK